MSITPRGMSIQEAYRLFRDEALVVNRRYQRKLVWMVEEKQLLVDSILENFPIPLILLATRAESSGRTRLEILDGMQRLDAIFSFIEQKFTFGDRHFDLGEFARARQAAEEGHFTPVTGVPFINPKACADFLDYQLAVTIFPPQSEKQVTAVFSRVNASGRQLSTQEKRQAGVINPFADLVRRIGSEIRGDVSSELVNLSNMPSVSIDSARERQNYGVHADETPWCSQGIISVKQLREGDDEHMIADLCSSILLGQPLAASKEKLDELYVETSDFYEDISKKLTAYGTRQLEDHFKAVFSIIIDLASTNAPGPNGLRNLVRPGSGNPIKGAFYAIFMAFFNLIVHEEKSPADGPKIFTALRGVGPSLASPRHFTTTEDRERNIAIVTGLIQKYFVKKEPPVLRHGPSLALDLRNSILRSRIETPRYEFKQGILVLDRRRPIEPDIAKKLVNTACAIANLGPNGPGYIFIGVTDKPQHSARVQALDKIQPREIGERHIVGIDREAKILGISVEDYVGKITGYLKSSKVTEPLKTQLLSQIDVVLYEGYSIIRITVPPQNEVSFVDDIAYMREMSSTVIAEGPRLLAITKLFPG